MQTVYANRLGALTDADVGRSPYGDVIGLHTDELEVLLDGDADRSAAAPDADDEVRGEAAAMDLGCQAERVLQQAAGGEVELVHDGLFCLGHGVAGDHGSSALQFMRTLRQRGFRKPGVHDGTQINEHQGGTHPAGSDTGLGSSLSG